MRAFVSLLIAAPLLLAASTPKRAHAALQAEVEGVGSEAQAKEEAQAYLSSRPRCFVAAVELAQREAALGAYEEQRCPVALALGARGPDHPPHLIGTPCEPWMNREGAPRAPPVPNPLATRCSTLQQSP